MRIEFAEAKASADGAGESDGGRGASHGPPTRTGRGSRDGEEPGGEGWGGEDVARIVVARRGTGRANVAAVRVVVPSCPRRRRVRLRTVFGRRDRGSGTRARRPRRGRAILAPARSSARRRVVFAQTPRSLRFRAQGRSRRRRRRPTFPTTCSARGCARAPRPRRAARAAFGRAAAAAAQNRAEGCRPRTRPRRRMAPTARRPCARRARRGRHGVSSRPLESRLERAEGAVAAAESAAVDARRTRRRATRTLVGGARATTRRRRARRTRKMEFEFASTNPTSTNPTSTQRESVPNRTANPRHVRDARLGDDPSPDSAWRRPPSPRRSKPPLVYKRALAEGASALAAVIAARNESGGCDACVAELGVGGRGLREGERKAFELITPPTLDAQRRRADECESTANGARRRARGAIAKIRRLGPGRRASRGTHRHVASRRVERAARRALAVNRARLAHAKSAAKASEADTTAARGARNDAAERARAAVADAERARAALRGARRVRRPRGRGRRRRSVQSGGGTAFGEGWRVGDRRRWKRIARAPTSTLADAARDAAPRRTWNASARGASAFGRAPTPRPPRSKPSPRPPRARWTRMDAAAGWTRRPPGRIECLRRRRRRRRRNARFGSTPSPTPEKELHARVGSSPSRRRRRRTRHDDDASHDRGFGERSRTRDREAADRAASAASSTAAPRLRHLGVAVDATDAAAAARDAAATAAALQDGARRGDAPA